MKHISKLIALELSVVSLGVPVMTAVPTMAAETYTNYSRSMRLALAGVDGRRDVSSLKESSDYNLWKKDLKTQKIFVSYVRSNHASNKNYSPDDLGYSYIDSDIDTVVSEYRQALPKKNTKYNAQQFDRAYLTAKSVGGVIGIRETKDVIYVTITSGAHSSLLWNYKISK